MSFLMSNWLYLGLGSLVFYLLAITNQMLLMRRMFKLDYDERPPVGRFALSAVLTLSGGFCMLCGLIGAIGVLLKS